jgi:D-alanyl-D-alanine dipeptidase
MHPLASVALALILFAVRPAQAQAQVQVQVPAPPGFVDAAAVVEGLVVDMRYFGDNNFVGARIDGYERARCLLSAPAARALAVIARDLAARTRPESVRLLSAAARGGAFRALGAAHRRYQAQA